MGVEGGEQRRYIAYMLRLWQAGNPPARLVWRASLEDPHSGERLAFRDQEALFAFLRDLLAGSPDKATHTATSGTDRHAPDAGTPDEPPCQ